MLWNALMLALREIRRNLLRSFPTLLGIVIGVGSAITMVAIGSGATAQAAEQIASPGSNLLVVSPGKRMGPGHATTPKPFELSDAEAIASSIGSISAVASVSSDSATSVLGNENWSACWCLVLIPFTKTLQKYSCVDINSLHSSGIFNL